MFTGKILLIGDIGVGCFVLLGTRRLTDLGTLVKLC